MYYRGGEGQWSYALHRLTGIGVFLFLLIHILDTFLILFGPGPYNHAMDLYKAAWFRPAEILLAAAVFYHAGNGVRITLYDLFPGTIRYHKQMFVIGALLFIILMVWTSQLMLRGVLW